MNENEGCFTLFTQPVNDYILPDKFTFPHYYQPKPIALLAAEQLQQHLAKDPFWCQYFFPSDQKQAIIGKMFGVLVVKDNSGQLGFLSAFSGTIINNENRIGFVPPIVDLLTKNSFLCAPQQQINQITETLTQLTQSPRLKTLEEQIQTVTAEHQQAIAAHRVQMIEARKVRKESRAKITKDQSIESISELMKQLAQQSIDDKNTLKRLVQEQQLAIQPLVIQLDSLNQQINALKQQRKLSSSALQKKIFSQFRLLNRDGKEKNLMALFKNTPQKIPPAGAGECAAPKLLQYAFKTDLLPIALAEFWWGAEPKSAIRKHLNYYGACIGKCQPILKHMLTGMPVEDNPLLINTGKEKELRIIYQDDDMLIINKPAEVLSVPGKHIKDSVYTRIKKSFPLASGPLIVHRLDMSTSGLMVIALNKKAHKALQRQFINRSITKRYVALIDGEVFQQSGVIQLPLCGDLNDRPRQKVCQLTGKSAVTEWQVIELCTDKGFPCTKVSLSPTTGRTHQLRVHCAHVTGLNRPIVGDDLYGKRAERLYLHAQSLSLVHPNSKKSMHFNCESPF